MDPTYLYPYVYIYIYIIHIYIYIYNCLRFANPAEATGGLEAWRLGGLEAGGSEPQVFLKGVFGRSLDVTCSKNRRQIQSFEFQHDLFQFQNDVKWHLSVSK